MSKVLVNAAALLCALGAGGSSALAADSSIVATSASPPAPTNLTATLVGPQQVNLSWTDNADNESGYSIAIVGGMCDYCVDYLWPDTTSYVHYPATPETTFTYYVWALPEPGSDSEAAVAVITTPPYAPQGLTATAPSPDQVNLTWWDISDAEDGYAIERCSGSGCADFAEIARIAGVVAGTPSYTDTAVAPTNTYRYRVRAFNDIGHSDYSGEAEATPPPMPPPPPAAPSGLMATAVAETQIDLSWTDNSSDEDGFKIERCIGSGCVDFVEISEVGANATSYSNTGLDANTTYRYRVRAFRQTGYSGYSNEAEATTPLPQPPAPPSNLTATGVTKTSASLAWTDNSGNEDGFRVYRCTGLTCTPTTLVATLGPNSQSYTNTGLSRRTTYRYRVTAYNGSGESAPSSIATAKTRN